MGASSFCALAPKPLKMLFCAGAGAGAEAPKPLKMPLVAGVLEVLCADVVVAPKVKGATAGAEVVGALGAPLVVPNIPPEGVALDVPNMPPEGAALDVPNMPPDGAALEVPNIPPEGAALDVPNIPPDGAALAVPNIPPEGAALAVPNIPPDEAELEVPFCPNPPKGLLCAWELPNIDPPNAGAGAVALPFVAGAELAANGFAAAPAVKLKPEDDGG